MEKTRLTDISFETPGSVTCPHCAATIAVEGLQAFDPVECPNCHKTFPLPVQFGSFILLELIGRGGMGAVFKGYDPPLKRTVAIKVMQRHLGRNAEFVRQFEREAQMMAALNSPYVVQVYSAGNEQGHHYIVMELVDRGQLASLIKQKHRLDETFVVSTAADVIRGLKAATEIGLTHGDLKPENILFDRQGRAKVVDFGLARFKGEQWQPGVIWGTPAYIAPEVVRGRQPHLQSDIYNLGCSLYYALSGKQPFDRPSIQETVLARLKEKAQGLTELRPDLHPETVAVVERMMEMDTMRRYPNYDSLLVDMTGAQAAIARGPAPMATSLKKPALRWWLGSSVVTMLVFAIVWFIVGHGKKPAEPIATPAPSPAVNAVEQPTVPPPATPSAPPAPEAVARKIADDASNYTNWGDGMTGGTGFSPWTLRCGQYSGFFIGSSTSNAGEGDIDKAGKAWGMFAREKDVASAWRTFSEGPLTVGSRKFVIDFDHGLIEKGGSVGLGLQNAASNTLWEFFFPGGAEHYTVRDAGGERDSGIPFSQGSVRVEFRLTSPTEYVAVIIADTSTITLKGALITADDQQVRVVHVWNYNAGEGSPHDVYFNHIAIVGKDASK